MCPDPSHTRNSGRSGDDSSFDRSHDPLFQRAQSFHYFAYQPVRGRPSEFLGSEIPAGKSSQWVATSYEVTSVLGEGATKEEALLSALDGTHLALTLMSRRGAMLPEALSEADTLETTPGRTGTDWLVEQMEDGRLPQDLKSATWITILQLLEAQDVEEALALHVRCCYDSLGK